MAVKLWAGVQVAVQSALAAEKTITGITKANPGVVTSVAHGYSNGDYVLLAIQGMSQLDGRVFRVSSVATDTFALEGEDTTGYDTFSSGTAKKITFGTTASTFTGLSSSGGEFDFIDISTIHDLVKKNIPGTASAASYNFDSIWDPADLALIAFKAASIAKATRAVRFTFSDGAKIVFNGYVGYTGIPTGNAFDKVQSPVAMTMFGLPTIYST